MLCEEYEVLQIYYNMNYVFVQFVKVVTEHVLIMPENDYNMDESDYLIIIKIILYKLLK